jgi:mono/diheme cytochrome c family protein
VRALSSIFVMKVNAMRQPTIKSVFTAVTVLAFCTTVSAEDIPEVNPSSGDAAAIRSGQSDYRAICSVCHGGKADGAGERASSALPPADLRKFKKGFRKFVEITKNGVQAPGREIKDMPAWDGVLDDKTIYKIGAYLETLAIEGANWKEGVRN